MKFVFVLSFFVTAYLKITPGSLLTSTSECEGLDCALKLLSKDDGTDLFQMSLGSGDDDKDSMSRILNQRERKLEKKRKRPKNKGKNKYTSKTKKNKSTPSRWLDHRRQRTNTKEEVERDIHEGARAVKEKMKKTTETKTNNIKVLINNHNKEMNRFIKLSNSEMKTLMAKLSQAKYLTTTSAVSTVQVGNQTASTIGNFVEKTGQDLTELAEKYVDRIQIFANGSCNRAKTSFNEGNSNKARTLAKELKEDLSKITYCGDVRINEIANSGYQCMMNLVGTTGKQIIDAAKQITTKFEEIGNSGHKKLQEYIDFGVRMINEMAQKMHSRLLTLAEECFKKVRELEAGNRKAIKDLGTVEGDICIAIMAPDKNREKALKDLKAKILQEMKKSNKKKFEELMEVEFEQMRKFREEISVSIDQLQACKANEASNC